MLNLYWLLAAPSWRMWTNHIWWDQVLHATFTRIHRFSECVLHCILAIWNWKGVIFVCFTSIHLLTRTNLIKLVIKLNLNISILTVSINLSPTIWPLYVLFVLAKYTRTGYFHVLLSSVGWSYQLCIAIQFRFKWDVFSVYSWLITLFLSTFVITSRWPLLVLFPVPLLLLPLCPLSLILLVLLLLVTLLLVVKEYAGR